MIPNDFITRFKSAANDQIQTIIPLKGPCKKIHTYRVLYSQSLKAWAIDSNESDQGGIFDSNNPRPPNLVT